MQISEVYSWLIQTIDGKIINKFNQDGTINKWQSIDKEKIIRFSFQPLLDNLQRHEVFIDIENGNRFIKYFGRGFLKQKQAFVLSEYVFCVVTKDFRVYVNHKGEAIITPAKYEMKL